MIGKKRINMALLWKAWQESKIRFWILLLGLILLVTYVVLSGSNFMKGYSIQHPDDPLTYTEYIWQALFNYYFQGLWIVSVIILGLGGILREKAQGLSSYTLGLPLARKQLQACRFYVGIIQSITLGVFPCCFIPLFSAIIGQSYPLSQALGFGFLLSFSGILFHGFSFFLSSLFPGEFTAFLAGLFLSSIAFFAFKAKYLHKWSVFDIMNGARSIDPFTHLLVRALPWPGIIICIVFTLLLFMASVQVINRYNF